MCSDFVTAAAPFLISDAFDTDLLLSCMEKLKHGKAVDIPSYDFKTHKSVSCARKVILYTYGAIHTHLVG
jgi:uridine kinase